MTGATTPSTRPESYSSFRPEPGPIVAAISGRGGSAALEAARLLSERLGVGGTVLSVLEPEPALVMGPDVQPIPPDFEEMRALERRASVAQQIGEVFGASPAWPFEVLYGLGTSQIGEGHEVVDDPTQRPGMSADQIIDQLGWFSELGVTATGVPIPPVKDVNAYLDYLQWVIEEIKPKVP